MRESDFCPTTRYSVPHASLMIMSEAQSKGITSDEAAVLSVALQAMAWTSRRLSDRWKNATVCISGTEAPLMGVYALASGALEVVLASVGGMAVAKSVPPLYVRNACRLPIVGGWEDRRVCGSFEALWMSATSWEKNGDKGLHITPGGILCVWGEMCDWEAIMPKSAKILQLFSALSQGEKSLEAVVLQYMQ